MELSQQQSLFLTMVGMVVNKRDMQKEAPKKYQEKMFEEFKLLEEQRAKEEYAHKVGSRKSKNAAKIGRIESDKALEWRSRPYVC